MNIDALRPRRHAAPAGWDARTFDAITDAIAAALVAAVRRTQQQPSEPRDAEAVSR